MDSRLAYGHKFLVFFGALTMSFTKITGISNELEVTQLNEGGNNNSMVLLHSPKKSAGRLIFEHGSGHLNPLNMSFDAAMLGYYFKIPGIIVAFDNNDIRRVYGYSWGAPVKWSLSDFDAKTGTILLDTVEILHNGIFEMSL